MRIALCLWLAILGYTLPAVAGEGAGASTGWGLGTFGLQATEWRVATHGIERGLMLAYAVSGVSSGPWWTLSGSQFLAVGAGEGGFQIEYLNRMAYGVRFLRASNSAFVLRGGATLEAIGMPHERSFTLGPLVDFGYQVLSPDGLLDFGIQTVVPVFPAILWNDSEHHPSEWFSTGPRVTAAFRAVYAEATVARTEFDGEFRTEFRFDLCGSAGLFFCTRLRNYRYDDDRKPSTLIAFTVGIGGTGPSRQSTGHTKPGPASTSPPGQ